MCLFTVHFSNARKEAIRQARRERRKRRKKSRKRRKKKECIDGKCSGRGKIDTPPLWNCKYFYMICRHGFTKSTNVFHVALNILWLIFFKKVPSHKGWL